MAGLAIPGSNAGAQGPCEVSVVPGTIVLEEGIAVPDSISVTGAGFPANTALTLTFSAGASIVSRTNTDGEFAHRVDVAPGSIYRADEPVATYRVAATGWEGGEPPYSQPADPHRLCRAETTYTVVADDLDVSPDTAVQPPSRGLREATPPLSQAGCVIEITPATIVVESGEADTQTITVTGRGFPAHAPLTLDFQPVGSIMDFRTDASGSVSEVIDVSPGSVYVPDDPEDADYLLVATAWEGDEAPHLQPTVPDRLCEAEAPYVVVAGEAGTIPNTAAANAGPAAAILMGLVTVVCLALLPAARENRPPVR